MYSLSVYMHFFAAVLVWIVMVFGIGATLLIHDRPGYWKLMSLFHGCIALALIREWVW